MKFLSFVSTILLTVLFVLPLSACGVKYGGAVESIEIKRALSEAEANKGEDLGMDYIYPTLNINIEIDYVYRTISVSKEEMKNYGCKNFEELMQNKDFTNIPRKSYCNFLARYGTCTTPIYIFDSIPLSYILIYEGREFNNDSVPESFHTIENPKDYIGYIEF